MYRLFSREISYFSGKVRAALRYKERMGSLPEGYEDILATADIVHSYLLPKTGTPLLPQLLCPDGTWLQDSSEILDHLDQQHPTRAITPPPTAPRQMLASLLLEFLGDEWLINVAFWTRWHFGRKQVTPNHYAFNAQQWSPLFRPQHRPLRRRKVAEALFKRVMGIERPQEVTRGPFAGLRDLGVNEMTQSAFHESYRRMMAAFEAHLDHHDFTLGGAPSLGDFGLLGPLYAHIYRDPISGLELRCDFPLVTEWIERSYGTNDLNARGYAQTLYRVDESGELVPVPATSDQAKLLADDAVPDSLLPLLGVFFEECWPVLRRSMDVLGAYYRDAGLGPGDPLPSKSFMASPGFESQQRDAGPLTIPFEIGGISSRRMLVPNHIWMLQRLENRLQAAIAQSGQAPILAFLSQWEDGPDLLALPRLLRTCRVARTGGALVVAET
ncbi:MAG: glutathione S-transferase family protein [Pseudomonadota bacterium]